MNQVAHLARIRLNPHSKDVQRDLRHATDMHRTLMRMVPDDLGKTPRQNAGLLFRLDHTEDADLLLVQATTVLTPQRLPGGYGTTEVKDLAPLFTALRANLPVRYRVALNPAKRARLPLERKEKKERGKIIPLIGAEADQWWLRRAEEAGLHVLTMAATPLRPATAPDHADHAVRHHLTRYDGNATVTDPRALTAALISGIGRGKSYGAGLLSLAPGHTA
jgi:CRISPR system Cascade subunit CasE